jgi:simple sugar transport system permease protein
MLLDALQLSVPIILAAIGGMITERAGVLNIGLEGLILAGAFGAAVGANLTGSFAVALLVAALVGFLLSLLFSVACLEMRSNIFVAGLATNLLAVGMIPYISLLAFGTKGVVRVYASVTLPRIAGISVLGYSALAIAAAVWYLLFRTRFGLRLRAAGENPTALWVRGPSPKRYQRAAMLLSGALAGLAGADIALRLGVYLPNISAGRGWIALVAVVMGNKHPAGVVIAAVVFALFESLSGYAQGVVAIPGTALLGVPYLITAAAMVLYAALRKRRGE